MAKPVFKDMWDAFVTTESNTGDGSQSCEAEIQATDPATGTTVTYYGSTRNNRGHAEIDALYQCLKASNWSVATFGALQVTVHCTAKPCCKFCSAIMGNLGIGAGAQTYKSKKPMGVSYALPPEVRRFLMAANNCTESDILEVYAG